MADHLTKAERAELRESLDLELSAHAESGDAFLAGNARRFQVLLALIDGNAEDARNRTEPSSLKKLLGVK